MEHHINLNEDDTLTIQTGGHSDLVDALNVGEYQVLMTSKHEGEGEIFNAEDGKTVIANCSFYLKKGDFAVIE
jgi:hypothetical protein